MSVIVTGMDIPKNCFECSDYTGENSHCLNNCFIPYGAEDDDSYRNKDCPLKSIDGLIEYIKDHSYPVRYDTNSIEQGMTITGIEQAIKEYCEVRK